MPTPTRFPLVAAALAAVPILFPTPLTAQSVAVSPADRATLEGSTSTSFPLGRHDARIQQIHDDLGAAPATLRGHAYRRDAESLRGVVAGFDATLEVIVSTAPHPAAAAVADFASNHGPDRTVVLPPTRISFPPTDRPASGPAPSFDLRVPYATPFSYAGGVPLCVEVVVHGNVTSNGADRNFSALLDAHAYANDGRSDTPGYRYGTGCAATGTTRTATAVMNLAAWPDGRLELGIDARAGVPSTSGVTSRAALLVGVAPAATPWPFKNGCTSLTSSDARFTLPGPVAADGTWSGSLAGLPALPVGFAFHAQIATAAPGIDVTFSDASVLTIPPLPPAAPPIARISSGSDRTATSGAVSTTAAVLGFF